MKRLFLVFFWKLEALFMVGVYFYFGSEVGIANSAGEASVHLAHKLPSGGGEGGIGGELVILFCPLAV